VILIPLVTDTLFLACLRFLWSRQRAKSCL